VYRIYYFGFSNNSGAQIIILPPLGKIWKSSLTAFATTKITENNHDKADGNHTYI